MTPMPTTLDTAVEYPGKSPEGFPEAMSSKTDAEIKEIDPEIEKLREQAEAKLIELLKKASYDKIAKKWTFYEDERKEHPITDSVKLKGLATQLYDLLGIKRLGAIEGDKILINELTEQMQSLKDSIDEQSQAQRNEKVKERAEKEQKGLFDKLRKVGKYLLEKAKNVLKLSLKLLLNPWVILAILVIASPFLLQGAVYLYNAYLSHLIASAGEVIKSIISALPSGIVDGISKAAGVISEIIEKVFGGETPLPVPA